MGRFKEVCGGQHANKYQTCELERREAAPYWGWRRKEGKSAAGRMAGWQDGRMAGRHTGASLHGSLGETEAVPGGGGGLW